MSFTDEVVGWIERDIGYKKVSYDIQVQAGLNENQVTVTATIQEGWAAGVYQGTGDHQFFTGAVSNALLQIYNAIRTLKKGK